MDDRYKNYGTAEDRVIEELAELTKAIGKARRFGWFSIWPRPDGPTNMDTVLREMDDVRRSMHELNMVMLKISRKERERQEMIIGRPIFSPEMEAAIDDARDRAKPPEQLEAERVELRRIIDQDDDQERRTGKSLDPGLQDFIQTHMVEIRQQMKPPMGDRHFMVGMVHSFKTKPAPCGRCGEDHTNCDKCNGTVEAK